jgi:hypothetical protein
MTGATALAAHGVAPRAAMSATRYEIHIKGKVSRQILAAFEGMEVKIGSADTILRGPMLDQAALNGLLDRISALGLELIEVRRMPE